VDRTQSDERAPGTLAPCDRPLSQVYDLALLDLDGVVYIGPDAVPGAADALAAARDRGMRTCFVTNNASRTPDAVAEHLARLGVPAAASDVVTSAQAAAALLARRLPPGAAVLVVGGEGLRQALVDEGLRPVASVDDGPRAVVQGFSPDIDWRLLAEGSRAIWAGIPWLATNTDPTVPTPFGPAPGNGTLVAAVATATGVTPEVAGKPQPPLFRQAVDRYGSTRPLVVGDRLDTDLEGARAAGIDGLLVLTGISRAAEVLAATPQQRPHFLGRDLWSLASGHPGVTQEGERGAWRCRGARVRVGADGVEVVDSGQDALDVLRAACAAVWARADATASGDRTPVPRSDHLVAALCGLEPAGPWSR
jgi:HAD superfamily hydrolase (TIGR01450 family)